MQDENTHDDHTEVTHSAKCDEEGCSYVAKVHAHDEETVTVALAHDLAGHNKSEHDKQTDPEEIKDAVRAKMQTHG